MRRFGWSVLLFLVDEDRKVIEWGQEGWIDLAKDDWRDKKEVTYEN